MKIPIRGCFQLFSCCLYNQFLTYAKITTGLRGLNLPLPIPRKATHYTILFKKYNPDLSAERLSRMTRREQRKALGNELEKI
jgi:hypothetical protein